MKIEVGTIKATTIMVWKGGPAPSHENPASRYPNIASRAKIW